MPILPGTYNRANTRNRADELWRVIARISINQKEHSQENIET